MPTSARSRHGEKIIVGVNEYVIEEQPPKILYIDESIREAQTAKLRKLRSGRSNETVGPRSDGPLPGCGTGTAMADNGISAQNTMPFILDCVRAYATVGEIAGALKNVMGEYREAGIV